jgi:DNA-binding transcriptional regulator of glucitol operon
VRDDRGVERALIVVVLAVVAVAVAFVVQRRRAAPAPTNTSHTLPDRLDRGDFDQPDAPWLVAVFTSATCSTCAGVWEKARVLASDQVTVQQLEAASDRELHGKYRVTAVPGIVIADAAGVVRARFLGPVTATDLWASLAELRAPGTLPAEAPCADLPPRTT